MITKKIHQHKAALTMGALAALLPLAAIAGSSSFNGGGYWPADLPSAGTFSSEAYVSGPGNNAMCTVYRDGGSTVYQINAFSSNPGIPNDQRASASVAAGNYDVVQVQSGSGAVAWTTVSW